MNYKFRVKDIKKIDKELCKFMKVCKDCGELKLMTGFEKCISCRDNRRGNCKICRAEYSKKYKKENKNKLIKYNKRYREENKDKIAKYWKEYHLENKDKIQEINKKYYDKNKDDILKRRKKYYDKNKDVILGYKKEYNKKHYEQQIKQSLQEIKEYIEQDLEEYKYNPNKKIYGVIYLVTNLNSQRNYIGQTKIGLNLRYKNGWLKAKEHSNKKEVIEDLQLYGEESFTDPEIIAVAYNKYDLDRLEAYYIDKYDSYENGYNRTRGNIFTNRGIDEDE